jgi:hypothetical protein
MIFQKRPFSSKLFVIQEQGLCIQHTAFRKFNEIIIPLENIGFNVTRRSSYNKDFAILFISSLIASVLFGYLFFSNGATIDEVPTMSKRNVKRVELLGMAISYFEIEEAKPDKAAVTAFIKELSDLTKQHLKNKYLGEKNASGEDKEKGLRYLLERSVISKEEYDALTLNFKYQ